MEFSRKGVRYAFGKKNNNQQYKLECGSPKMLAWKVIRSCKWRENAKLSININCKLNFQSYIIREAISIFSHVICSYLWLSNTNEMEKGIYKKLRIRLEIELQKTMIFAKLVHSVALKLPSLSPFLSSSLPPDVHLPWESIQTYIHLKISSKETPE